MIITDVQDDLRRAYVGGGPGAVVSGLVWLVAAVAMLRYGTGAGFAHLFIGGVLIFPLSKLVCRLLFRRASEMPGNPGGTIVLESTAALIAGLVAAWVILPQRPELVFPLAALAVGTRYFVFQSAYGDRTYWLLAAAVTGAGLAGAFLPPFRALVPVAVSLVELGFGLAITLGEVRRDRLRPPTLH